MIQLHLHLRGYLNGLAVDDAYVKPGDSGAEFTQVYVIFLSVIGKQDYKVI